MVPLRLSLKNFLSYGQTTQHVNFEPYNLICLSGKNGHGKSALLDALTWVLWGHARKANTGARADENLIRLGQTQMMVSLEFICNNATYRVRRELNISGNKAQTTLDFGIIDPESQQVRGLTDKTIRATQEKITTTIGLDYESFINSVFLRQGSSNEFSKKSPKERKEILSSILGITQFELIKRKALDKYKLLITQKETLLPIHQRLSSEITQKETLVAMLKQAEEQERVSSEKLAFTTHQLQQAELLLQQQTQNKLLLTQAEETHNTLRLRIGTGLQELHTAYLEFKKILSKKIEGHKPEYYHHEQLEKELESIQTYELARLHSQQKIMHKKQELQKLATDLEHEHTQKLHSVDVLIQQTGSRIALHEKRFLELRNKNIHLQKEIDIKIKDHDTIFIIQKYEKYRELYSKFVSQKNILTTKMHDSEHTIQKLSSSISAFCPTCTTLLDPDKKNDLCRIQKKELHHISHQLTRLQKLLPALKQTVINQHALVEQLKEAHHLKKNLHEISAEQETVMHEYEQEKLILKNYSEDKEELIRTQKTLLLTHTEYQQIAREIAELTEHLATIPETSEDKKQALIEQLKLNKLHNELTPENISPLLQQTKKMVHVTSAYLKTLKRENSDLEEKLENLKRTLSDYSQTEQNVTTLRIALTACTQEAHRQSREIGSYKEQLARLELQEKEFFRLEESMKESEQQQELYHTIAHAVGKDGIQALLIEQALPEIEQEANHLLSKLTDNQAHLFIESLRDLKSGKSKETLDIHISDATGIRAYELFSGGEAFRIDFALRIALSKLLARRAGTSLQTLIIDEGFGSQDEEGIAHIMEALYKIQDDFAKIIIVSHLPYMKDQFPVHFVVNKSAHGSTLKVFEQG